MTTIYVKIISQNPTDGVLLGPDPIDKIFNVPSDYLNLKPTYLIYENGSIREKTSEEKAIIDLPLKYRFLQGIYWIEKSQINKDQADTDELISWQNNKSTLLKTIENIYVDFIENMWTEELRINSIIANDYTITVQNTNELQNIQYLIQLRNMDFDTYNKMASEFERLKNLIVNQNGIMSKVQRHTI